MANPILITDSELQGNLKNVYADIRQQLFPISTVLFAQIKKAGPGYRQELRRKPDIAAPGGGGPAKKS